MRWAGEKVVSAGYEETRAEDDKLWPGASSAYWPVSVNKLVFSMSLFSLWWQRWQVNQHRPHGLQNCKYLLCAHLQKTFANPWIISCIPTPFEGHLRVPTNGCGGQMFTQCSPISLFFQEKLELKIFIWKFLICMSTNFKKFPKS